MQTFTPSCPFGCRTTIPAQAAPGDTPKEWLQTKTLGYLKALGDANRLRILLALQKDVLSVTELAALTATGASNVCGHLSQLMWAGLVSKKQQGNTIFYSLTDTAVFDIIEQAYLLSSHTRRPPASDD
jgi:DNA-binding transcriptional ArsR family regulator